MSKNFRNKISKFWDRKNFRPFHYFYQMFIIKVEKHQDHILLRKTAI